MMTSTWSTSANLRTALTASPGVARLSAKEASIRRPMTPPRALISSTASMAPHCTPSPVMAAGPLMAEAKPTRMGGAWAAAGRAASRVAARGSVSGPGGGAPAAHRQWGMTSCPNRSMASCISGTELATKSNPEQVVTPARW